MERKNNHRVVCFGEVLWDILPSGAVPGGAPMNVAYHLHKQGKHPALITRVGRDQEGQELRAVFSREGVCTDYFQVDDLHETGKVFAQPNEHNEMVYDIVQPVAWDFIEWNETCGDLVSHADYFVFGSLAARNPKSKTTLLRLLEAAKTKVLDINLRAPHYNKQIVEKLLGHTDFLKLNQAELELIAGWFFDYRNTEEQIKSLADRFGIAHVVVTMGGNGAVLYMEGKIYKHPGFRVAVTDTVGSGDAFLAGLLSKLMEQFGPQDALEFANGLGAFIATKTGACPHYETSEVLELIQKNTSLNPL